MQQKPSSRGPNRPLFDGGQHRLSAISPAKKSPSKSMNQSGEIALSCRDLVWLFLVSMLLFTSPVALAVTTLTVKVTVLAAPSCVINGGNPIEVRFSDEVVTTRVDGYNYTEVIPAHVTCSGLTRDSLRLKVQGTPAYFGTNVLATEQDDLGIALLSNGKPLRLNENIQFTYPDVPVLSAVPVKYTGAKLAAGQFSAGATLTVEYQ